MRTVDIDLTGPESPVEYFAGYRGEINSTLLNVVLPATLIGNGIDYYRANFKTAEQDSFTSEKLYADNGSVKVLLGYELTRDVGTVLLQLTAYDVESNELVKLGKSPTVKLKIKPSLPSSIEGNLRVQGLEAELAELIEEMREGNGGSTTVMVNTFTDLPANGKDGTFGVVRSSVVDNTPEEPFDFINYGDEPYAGCFLSPTADPETVFEQINEGLAEPVTEISVAFANPAAYRLHACKIESADSAKGIIRNIAFSKITLGADYSITRIVTYMKAFETGTIQDDWAENTGEADLIPVVAGWNKVEYSCVTVNDNLEVTRLSSVPVEYADLPNFGFLGGLNEDMVPAHNAEYFGHFASTEPYTITTKNRLFVKDGTTWLEILA